MEQPNHSPVPTQPRQPDGSHVDERRLDALTKGSDARTPDGLLLSSSGFAGDRLEAVHPWLATVLENAPVVLFAIDPRGLITLSLGNGLRPLGLKPNETVGRNVFEMYAGEPDVIDGVRRALSGEEFRSTATVGDVTYDVAWTALRDRTGQLTGTIGVATDVSARQRAEHALQEAHAVLDARVRERTAELSRANDELTHEMAERQQVQRALIAERRALERMLQAHERDRQLIAYEIHDGLIQELTGAHLRMETALAKLAQGQPDAALLDIDAAERVLKHSLDEARRLIAGLRPPILDEHGVVAAIEFLLREAPLPGGGAIEFQHDVRFDRLSPLLEATLYRIVQEAVTNIRRHSGAARAEVCLREVDGRVRLDVRDWGRGFDPALLAENRYGVQGIRERARLLRGTATISSTPAQGTHLCVELPITHSRARPNEGEVK